MRTRARAKSVGLLAALALVALACGTTVEGAEEALRAGGASRDEFVLDTASGGGDAPGPGAVTQGSTEGSGAARGTTPTSGGPATSGGGAADPNQDASETTAGTAPEGASTTRGAAPATGPVGQGVTDSTIKVGMIYDRSAGAIVKAAGFAGIGQIDQKRAIELVVEYINEHGGVAGRKIEIVWYVADTASGKSLEQMGQEACATWTQDNQVFAVAALTTGIDTLNACLTEAGVVQVDGGFGTAYSETFRRFPYFVDVGAPALDNLARQTVAAFDAKGFYDEARPGSLPVGGEIKVGVVAYDEPGFKAAVSAFEAALGDRGVALSEKAFITRAQTVDQRAQVVNQVRAAALRFKERGVTHVQFFMTSEAFGQFTFWQNADSLNYRPRYGLTSLDAAQTLTPTFESTNPGGPRRQFEMAVGLGFGPLRDVPRADYSGDAESAELRRCKEITRPASGGGFDDPARNKEIIAGALCDVIFYFQAAVNAGGPTPNVDSWLRGVASISEMGAAATFLLRTNAQRDAVGAFRDFAHFPDCNCFHYTSRARRS